MDFDAILLAPRRAAMIEGGLWYDRTINDALDACLRDCPDKTALTAVQLADGSVRAFSYRELAAMADRIAMGLVRLGVGQNDVVSVQLPNSWQFTATYLACSRIGAVINPLMTIFRERELSFMLRHGGSKVMIVPKSYRGFDFEQMLTALSPALPDLQQVVVVGGTGANGFERLLSEPAWENEPNAPALLRQHRPLPDDITQLIYTSGTTGEPKGVMHSANTLMANIVPYAERLHLGPDDTIFMASPMAHQTGFMYGLMMPIVLKASAVLQDIWEPGPGAENIRRYRATFTMASTPFLTDLTRVVHETGQAVPTLKTFLCAGAPVPGPLVQQAREVLGTKIVSAWGMTENGAVTLIRPEDDDARAASTDGSPLPGVELKVADALGHGLPTGEVGRLLVRASSNFGGYLKRPQWNATDAEGWFDTGDLARSLDDGYIRIAGRSKDVIIRGGENIPVFEIESLLYKHPAVAQVAIVAYPDERLGERACAFVVVKAGQRFDFGTMIEHLKGLKVAAPYMPERLVLQDAMPTTPSGKIQKFKLRELIRSLPA
ncbi:MAG: Cyclohexanecarboxylate--CoA ligase [Burkholderiaceae bacterium]|jgi:cyclohexanecarboxylate-CoA ligase|nr:MAG: Cyclohexanecarboxylate--CoA ligase [Burkholderiaceae bacterium]